jgi:hypothetical protein
VIQLCYFPVIPLNREFLCHNWLLLMAEQRCCLSITGGFTIYQVIHICCRGFKTSRAQSDGKTFVGIEGGRQPQRCPANSGHHFDSPPIRPSDLVRRACCFDDFGLLFVRQPLFPETRQRSFNQSGLEDRSRCRPKRMQLTRHAYRDHHMVGIAGGDQ